MRCTITQYDIRNTQYDIRNTKHSFYLFQFDLCADGLELLLDLLSLLFRYPFFDRLRGSFDKVLGLFEAQARDRADCLDDGNLVAAEARENDIELVFLGCSFTGVTTGSRACSNSYRSCTTSGNCR